MDTILCDELLQEIFHRLRPPSSASSALVCKRWRRLIRSSTTSLSLCFHPPYNPTTITSFSSFLSHHPFLSSLSVSGTGGESGNSSLILAIAASCPNLRHLCFLGSPVSPFSLYSLSTSCIHLTSIAVTVSRPLSFHWLPSFNSLKSLSLSLTNPSTEITNAPETNEVKNVELNLEILSLSRILPGDDGISIIWSSCKNVKKLQLKSCESIGDYSSFSGFLKSLTDLQELELRTCRSIADLVLLNLVDTCFSLHSLLIYDGCSRESLLRFINQTKYRLRRLDLRLPLDLDNTHLIALSENLNFKNLTSLRLHSCCLVTGEGLIALARATSKVLEEIALINCDVVDMESGLLTTLGHNLKRLRKLDLSYNGMLIDKELVSMLASCNSLVELKLRGCNRLTNASVGSIVRSCKKLQHVDITYCCQIEILAVDFLVMNCVGLRRVEVEQNKLSEVAKKWASDRLMEVIS